jgi:16S rRNA (guanine527-N7)-methyltransferase
MLYTLSVYGNYTFFTLIISGGGLPGLPMAIVNPEAHFTLIDSNSKKMKVVQNIVDTLKLPNVKVVCSRAEDYHEKHDFILGKDFM